MTTIRCLVVDDELPARQLLTEYVRQVHDLTLVRTCASALQARETLHTKPIDLIFLDIQMPHLTGMAWLRTLSAPPLVIITTAYAEHAVEGFELQVVDYLLKPFSFERFLQAIDKVYDRLKHRPPSAGAARGETAPQRSDADTPAFFVKADRRLVRIRYEEILYVEGLKEYVSIYTTKGARIVTLLAIRQLEEQLPRDQFIRIHKSYLVPIARIDAVDGNQVEIATKLLPIGKTYRDQVRARLRLSGGGENDPQATNA